MLSIQNVPRSRVKKLLLIEIPHNDSFFCLLKCDMTWRRSYRSARSLSCINGTPPFQGTRKLPKPTDINRNTSSRMQLRSFTISFMYHKHFKDLRESAEISSHRYQKNVLIFKGKKNTIVIWQCRWVAHCPIMHIAWRAMRDAFALLDEKHWN